MYLGTKTLIALRNKLVYYFFTLFVAIISSAVITTTALAGCGSLTIAEMNWASAEFMANDLP